MPRTSPAYAITRRRGKLGTIHRQIATSTNDDLLTRSDTFSADVVRYMYQGETRYNRLLRANAAQQRVGDVTFVVCLTDVTFTSVQAEDRIDYQGTLYEVTGSQILDDGLIIEARVFDGS